MDWSALMEGVSAGRRITRFIRRRIEGRPVPNATFRAAVGGTVEKTFLGAGEVEIAFHRADAVTLAQVDQGSYCWFVVASEPDVIEYDRPCDITTRFILDASPGKYYLQITVHAESGSRMLARGVADVVVEHGSRHSINIPVFEARSFDDWVPVQDHVQSCVEDLPDGFEAYIEIDDPPVEATVRHKKSRHQLKADIRSSAHIDQYVDHANELSDMGWKVTESPAGVRLRMAASALDVEERTELARKLVFTAGVWIGADPRRVRSGRRPSR